MEAEVGSCLAVETVDLRKLTSVLHEKGHTLGEIEVMLGRKIRRQSPEGTRALIWLYLQSVGFRNILRGCRRNCPEMTIVGIRAI